MIKSRDEVRWGKYLTWEGPYYMGSVPYSVPQNPTEEDRLMAVLTATEGGRFDMINMYDRCVMTAGLIQWCDAGQYSVCDMLGQVLEASQQAFSPIQSLIDSRGIQFKKNARGRYRFFFDDWRGEVDRLEEQTQLWLHDSTGKEGSWSEEAKEWAKEWVVAVATTLSHADAIQAQIRYTVPRLHGFVMKDAIPIVYGPWPTGSGKWAKATQAAFISFAGNLPAVAGKMAVRFAQSTKESKGTPAWTYGLLRELTFGPNITIYPGRYERIRPVIERLFDVDLPDFADDLKEAAARNVALVSDYPESEMDTVEEIQEALIKLGYDLGPKGADGRMGPKTQQAIISFQQAAKLKVDGLVGPKTKSALYFLSKSA